MKLVDESCHKAVITTRYVLSAGSAVTYVVYDKDGDWQFYGNEDVDTSDARIVSVKQILELDKTLESIPDLQRGQSASRLTYDSNWIV